MVAKDAMKYPFIFLAVLVLALTLYFIVSDRPFSPVTNTFVDQVTALNQVIAQLYFLNKIIILFLVLFSFYVIWKVFEK